MILNSEITFSGSLKGLQFMGKKNVSGVHIQIISEESIPPYIHELYTNNFTSRSSVLF